MLTWGDDVEAQALARRGWSISAIARHTGHDRKTIRAYLNGERQPDNRKPVGPAVIDAFVDYCPIRLADDPHLWATTAAAPPERRRDAAGSGELQCLLTRTPARSAGPGSRHRPGDGRPTARRGAAKPRTSAANAKPAKAPRQNA